MVPPVTLTQESLQIIGCISCIRKKTYSNEKIHNLLLPIHFEIVVLQTSPLIIYLKKYSPSRHSEQKKSILFFLVLFFITEQLNYFFPLSLLDNAPNFLFGCVIQKRNTYCTILFLAYYASQFVPFCMYVCNVYFAYILST